MSPDLFCQLQTKAVWAQIKYKYTKETEYAKVFSYKQSDETFSLKDMNGKKFSLPKAKIEDITRVFHISNFIKNR